jgi:hypothetical protein
MFADAARHLEGIKILSRWLRAGNIGSKRHAGALNEPIGSLPIRYFDVPATSVPPDFEN